MVNIPSALFGFDYGRIYPKKNSRTNKCLQKAELFVTGFRGVKLIHLYNNRKIYKNQ